MSFKNDIFAALNNKQNLIEQKGNRDEEDSDG